MKKLIPLFILATFMAWGCKSSKETTKTQQEAQPYNKISIPPSFAQVADGLSSEQLRQIYFYAQQKAQLVCELEYQSINTNKFNKEDQKEKVIKLERQIQELQVEIDEFIEGPEMEKAFIKAYDIEYEKCKY